MSSEVWRVVQEARRCQQQFEGRCSEPTRWTDSERGETRVPDLRKEVHRPGLVADAVALDIRVEEPDLDTVLVEQRGSVRASGEDELKVIDLDGTTMGRCQQVQPVISAGCGRERLTRSPPSSKAIDLCGGKEQVSDAWKDGRVQTDIPGVINEQDS